MDKAGPYSIGSDTFPGMSKLIEEMGELQQVLGKLIATGGKAEHWDGSDLRQRLHEEIADVGAALAFFVDANDLDLEAIIRRKRRKEEQFESWHNAQRQQ